MINLENQNQTYNEVTNQSTHNDFDENNYNQE